MNAILPMTNAERLLWRVEAGENARVIRALEIFSRADPYLRPSSFFLPGGVCPTLPDKIGERRT